MCICRYVFFLPFCTLKPNLCILVSYVSRVKQFKQRVPLLSLYSFSYSIVPNIFFKFFTKGLISEKVCSRTSELTFIFFGNAGILTSNHVY